jgi:exodeoxyribonuclease VII small subunit
MTADNKSDSIQKVIAKLSFEKAFAELKSATERLETEEIDLESTLKEYSRASALARHCANLLDEAEGRVKVLIESEGVMQLVNMDTDDIESAD